MFRNRNAWLVCTAAALFACSSPTQPTDAGRTETGTGTDAARPDAARPDVTPPPMDAAMEAGTDPCAALTTCDSCAAAAECGFCLSNGRCLPGTAGGSNDGMCSGTSWAFTPSACMPAADAGGPEAGGDDGGTPPTDGGGMMCPMGQTDCGGTCVDTQTSASNCGMCGTACAMGQVCNMGVCGAPMCAGTEMLCGGRCVNVQTDTANCGACGTACAMGQTCNMGRCEAMMMMCPAGETNCSGTCVNTNTSAANCGACGRACAMGQTCAMGMCTGTVVCPMGQTACGAACADLQSDPINCGACGRTCAMGQTCTMGMCTTPRPMCPAGQTDCTPMAATPTCVNLQTSNANCGACGVACPAGQTCNMGACACGAGQTLCGRTCVNTTNDVNNCGACGRVCSAPMGGTATCTMGVCGTACPMGQSNCSGTCRNLQTDSTNCGTCGTTCTGGTSCTAGRCACPAGQMACGMPATCINTQTDRNNCGACGRVCAMGQTCNAGTCACPMGQTLCGSGATAMCVDLQTNSSNCGMCGTTCMAGTSCMAGMCRGTPPANDTRAGATVINLTAPSQTLAANTTAARNDTRGACGCTAGNDVFFRFTLTTPEIVMAETLGATWDTSLFIQDMAGTNVTAPAGFVTCMDDTRECGHMGTQSLIYTRLPAGTYFLVLSGCGAGTANIKFQHIPAGNGSASRIAPDATVRQAMSTTAGTGAISTACCSGGAENSFFWLTCPGTAATAFQADTCNTMTGATLANYDVELSQHSALRGTVACNDDIGGVCGSGSSFNATIPATMANQIGLNSLVVDGCSPTGTATVNYVLANCAGTTARCGATCADLQNDRLNCGACDRRCPGTENCRAGACVPAPANDLPTAPVVINMSVPQSTFTVDTFSAVNNTTGTCGCTSGQDAFYQFTIAAGQQEIVYADTIGSMHDTSLFFQTAAGANIAAAGLANGTTCNDDFGLAGCNTARQSQVMALLGAGTYRLVVSGCAGGVTNVRFQHLPVGNGPLAALAAGNSTPGGTTAGTGRVTGSCSSGGPENTYYWYTCPASAMGTFTANTCGRATWDTSLHQSSANRAMLNVCNDDVGGACGNRSSISSTIPAGPGIHTLYVDGFGTSAGAYTVAVTRP